MTDSHADIVARTLENFAARGVFRGFSRGNGASAKTPFKMLWHRDQMFELIFDEAKSTLRFPVVLPNVPADSSMYKELKDYIKGRQSDELPDHRRVDKAKAELRTVNRGGNVSLSLKIKDGDCEYGARKIVNLVHEIYMIFLYDGRYFDYMVETFDLDPDHP